MNDIQVFSTPQFGAVRTAGTADNPMFCLADVCNAIGITNARNVKNRLDEDDVHLVDTIDNLGRTQQVTFVTESGLYDVIIRSDSEQARPFRKWVTSEILPSIRKTGAYMTTATIEKVMNDPDSWIKLLQTLKEERQQRQLAESKASLLEEITKEQAPKVAFADAVLSSPDSILVNELAKILCQRGYKTGEIRLYEQLRNEGYLCKTGSDYNLPKQEYLEMGLFEVTKGTRSGNGGIMHTTRTTKVTPKGCQYFINKFIGKPQTLFTD